MRIGENEINRNGHDYEKNGNDSAGMLMVRATTTTDTGDVDQY